MIKKVIKKPKGTQASESLFINMLNISDLLLLFPSPPTAICMAALHFVIVCFFFLMRFVIIPQASISPGINRVPTHEPTAILAMAVRECTSASTEDAGIEQKLQPILERIVPVLENIPKKLNLGLSDNWSGKICIDIIFVGLWGHVII
jgi:hypothetical protein